MLGRPDFGLCAPVADTTRVDCDGVLRPILRSTHEVLDDGATPAVSVAQDEFALSFSFEYARVRLLLEPGTPHPLASLQGWAFHDGLRYDLAFNAVSVLCSPIAHLTA